MRSIQCSPNVAKALCITRLDHSLRLSAKIVLCFLSSGNAISSLNADASEHCSARSPKKNGLLQGCLPGAGPPLSCAKFLNFDSRGAFTNHTPLLYYHYLIQRFKLTGIDPDCNRIIYMWRGRPLAVRNCFLFLINP